ncbi:MFS transporter [Paracoccus sp. S-4012]|uniref:MFS transporter n=1 Tax=Paracoccus sp. S-4012 TaxID=2665648 RepID=UPI0012B0EB9A|nr:MFS transporter [Paracoccus sp. S-4012]MRX51404.1 MFS transporter [Paracoccus sp. S-4012]
MTAATMTDTFQPRRMWRNIIVLVLAQSFLGAQMSVQFIAGGLAGQSIAPNPCLATLPLSMMILGSTLSARPLAGFMQVHGRQMGFVAAALIAAVGAALSTWGLWQGNFWVFMAGMTMSGVYMAAQGFYRFAATDTASPEMQPKAISYVLAGGLVSAITGPLMVSATAGLTAIPFLATYAGIVALNLVLGPLLFSQLDIPVRPRPVAAAGAPRLVGLRDLTRRPVVLVAMICGMVSYALMNLVMTSTPLAMVGCGFSEQTVSGVVSAHILAMYLPSFVTGHVIARFGAPRVVGTGLVILAAAGAVALSGVEITHFLGALVLLGIGWNFGYIGATAMLTGAQNPEERERIQGINDFVVFGGVFLASLSSGGLLNCAAATPQAGWSAVNMAMLPFLVLAGGALIWLTMRPKEA